jgi:hypothetical protein
MLPRVIGSICRLGMPTEHRCARRRRPKEMPPTDHLVRGRGLPSNDAAVNKVNAHLRRRPPRLVAPAVPFVSSAHGSLRIFAANTVSYRGLALTANRKWFASSLWLTEHA